MSEVFRCIEGGAREALDADGSARAALRRLLEGVFAPAGSRRRRIEGLDHAAIRTLTPPDDIYLA